MVIAYDFFQYIFSEKSSEDKLYIRIYLLDSYVNNFGQLILNYERLKDSGAPTAEKLKITFNDPTASGSNSGSGGGSGSYQFEFANGADFSEMDQTTLNAWK